MPVFQFNTHRHWKSKHLHVPTRTGKHGKMGMHFPVREFCQNWKSQGILLKILEKSEKKYTGKLIKNIGKVREISQPVIVQMLQIWYHTLNNKRTLKKYWKTVKNTGRVREIC